MNRLRTIAAGAVLLSASLLLGGCGGSAAASGTVVTVTAGDTMRYNPDTITVKPGEAVTIAFHNAATIPHDLIVQGGDKSVRLVNVGPGKEQRGTFLASKPGTYEFYCNQPGHKEAGMVGKIVVG